MLVENATTAKQVVNKQQLDLKADKSYVDTELQAETTARTNEDANL